MQLTNEQLIAICDLIMKAIELQNTTSDASYKAVMSHIVSRLNDLL